MNAMVIKPNKDTTRLKHDQLIRMAVPMVKEISQKVKRKITQLDMDSIEAAGLLGAFNAAKRFNPLKETDFLIFARKHIHGAIVDWLRDLDPLTRTHRAKINKGKMPSISFKPLEKQCKSAKLTKPSKYSRFACEQAEDPFCFLVEKPKTQITWDDYTEQRKVLTPHDRVVLALYCVEGYTLKQIGEVFGRSLFSVWRQIHDIKKTLHEGNQPK